MNVDFDNILAKLRKISDLLENVKGIYKNLDWKDNVYDSYGPYDNDISILNERVKSYIEELNKLAQNLTRIENSSEIIEEIQSIRNS